MGLTLRKIKDQLDFLDNGKTAANPQGNGQNLSTGQQARNLGFGAVHAAVDPVVRFPLNISNMAGNLGRRAAGVPGQTVQQQFNTDPVTTALTKYSKPTGSIRQTAGDAAQIALAAAAPVAGKAGSTVARPIVNNTVRKVVSGAATGAIAGAPLGAAGVVSDDKTPLTIKNVARGAATGAALGAGLGGAAPVAGEAVRGVAKIAVKGANKAIDYNAVQGEAGHIKIPGAKGETPAKEFNADTYVAKMADEQKAARQSDAGARTSQAAHNVKSKFIDTFSPIEDIVKKSVKDGATIPAEKNITHAIDRSLRGDQIAGQYIKDNGLDKIIQSVPNPQALDQYMIARHSRDLETNGIKTGRDTASDKALLDELGPQYEAHAQAVNEYSQKLLDKAADYGLVSKNTAAFLKAKYPNYVPINRIFTDEELQGARGNGAGPASITTQTVVRRLKGSDRVIESPLDSIIKKTQTVIEQGERNKAASILASYKELPGNPLSLREMKPSEQVGTKSTIAYLDKGRLHRFETTPEIAAAAKSLNKEQLGLLGKILSYPTRVLRLGATGVNVGFAAANVVKDIGSAIVNSKHPIRSSILNPDVFLDALKASLHHGGEQHSELVREGAGGTSFDIARDNPVRNIKVIRSQRNIATNVGYTVTHPRQLLRAVENTIGRSEEFGRALQYFGNKKAFLSEGDAPGTARIRAAHEARNNTVNFARAGDYGRTLNTVLPYLNAGVQGSRTLLRNLRDRPIETATKIAITAFLPVAVTTAWALNDPERKKVYDSISTTDKENNIIIVPPHPKPDGSNVIKIPISQEVANLSNVVRNGVETMHKDTNFNFKQLAGDLIGTTTSLQAQSPRQVAGQFTPQAVKPVVETMTNQNLYFGNDIVPDAVKNLKPEDQYTKDTSGTAKAIGHLTNTSPLQIDNAIKTTTGGAGQNLVHLADQGLAKAGVIKPDDVGGKGFVKSITGRFVGANVQTPGAKYFSTLESEAKNQNLAGKDQALLNALKTKEVDPNGSPIPQSEQDALNSASIRANNPRVVAVETATAKKVAKDTGQALDPIYGLTPEQQQTYYRIQSTPYKSDDYNRLTDKAKDWLPAFQNKRSTFFDQLNATNSIGVTPSSRVKYPTFSQGVQSKLDTYFATDDSAARAQMLKDNPDVTEAFDKINQYTNARRIAQGYDPFKDYPKTDPTTEQALSVYMGLPAGTGARSQWINANKDTYQNIQKYLADTAAWQLANNAGEAKYEGTDLNQKALKAASSLGQYDIFKDAGGQYSIDPQAVYASSQAKKSSSYSNNAAKSAFKYAVRVKSASGKGKKVAAKRGLNKVSLKKSGSSSTPKYAVSLKKSLV